jgi:hypothetical protein
VEEVTNEQKISFIQAQVQAVRSLRKAFEMDAEREKLIRGSGKEDPTPRKNVKAWFKTGWVNVVVWLLAAAIVWKFLEPKKAPKRSHHGVNKFGVPY